MQGDYYAKKSFQYFKDYDTFLKTTSTSLTIQCWFLDAKHLYKSPFPSLID